MKTIVVDKYDHRSNVFKWIEDNVYRIRAANNDPDFRFNRRTINEELAKIGASMDGFETPYLELTFKSEKHYSWFVLKYGL